MATDANTLLSETACYDCLSEAEWRMIQLGLLQQILLASSPMADTSANALLAAAQCYSCLGEKEWRMIELALLQQIVDAGGGGGGAQEIFNDEPVPSDPRASRPDPVRHVHSVQRLPDGPQRGRSGHRGRTAR